VSYLLAVPVEEGSDDVVVFEVDRSTIMEDQVLASREPGLVVARTRTTLEEALTHLKPSLSKIVHTLHGTAPDEMEVEFGLKMGGETGVIVAKGTAEVNFRITLCWRSSTRKESGN
jgi:Trypsin-co-occurring domain 1